LILRELHEISANIQRKDDSWCFVWCVDPTTAEKISINLQKLGYEVYIEKQAKGQNICFRRLVPTGSKRLAKVSV
jgi:hypothetical protein